MPVHPATVNPGQHLQRLARVARIYTDNHNRKFYAEADAASNQPIGELRVQDCTPPWTPPNRFAKFKREGDLHFAWDYQSMADELSGDTAAFYEAATKFALEHNLPVPEVGGVVDRRISAVFGPPPLSPEVPIAAQMGDPWLLGVPGADKNTELAALIQQGTGSTGNDALRQIRQRVERRLAGMPVTTEAPQSTDTVTYQQFVSEGRKTGMSMADLAVAWKAHKDNLEEAA